MTPPKMLPFDLSPGLIGGAPQPRPMEAIVPVQPPEPNEPVAEMTQSKHTRRPRHKATPL